MVMPKVEVDQQTDDYLALAAKVAGISKGQVVTQLVVLARSESPSAAPVRLGGDREVAIHADYEGHRTNAQFIRGPGRIEIIDGPIAGESFKTPSEAAVRVVREYNPEVNPNRNGWTFWVISETGAPLQTIRYDDV
jgi:hypothetical protein